MKAPHNAAIVAAARSWVGTPYLHQGRRRGVGADCIGLVLGVWEDVCGPVPEQPPAYSQDWSEATGDEALWQGLRRHLRPRSEAVYQPGDILLFRVRERGVAKHLGILSIGGAEARFIHAYARIGVVESRLTQPWARRIVARFAFPEGH